MEENKNASNKFLQIPDRIFSHISNYLQSNSVVLSLLLTCKTLNKRFNDPSEKNTYFRFCGFLLYSVKRYKVFTKHLTAPSKKNKKKKVKFVKKLFNFVKVLYIKNPILKTKEYNFIMTFFPKVETLIITDLKNVQFNIVRETVRHILDDEGNFFDETRDAKRFMETTQEISENRRKRRLEYERRKKLINQKMKQQKLVQKNNKKRMTQNAKPNPNPNQKDWMYRKQAELNELKRRKLLRKTDNRYFKTSVLNIIKYHPNLEVLEVDCLPIKTCNHLNFYNKNLKVSEILKNYQPHVNMKEIFISDPFIGVYEINKLIKILTNLRVLRLQIFGKILRYPNSPMHEQLRKRFTELNQIKTNQKESEKGAKEIMNGNNALVVNRLDDIYNSNIRKLELRFIITFHKIGIKDPKPTPVPFLITKDILLLLNKFPRLECLKIVCQRNIIDFHSKGGQMNGNPSSSYGQQSDQYKIVPKYTFPSLLKIHKMCYLLESQNLRITLTRLKILPCCSFGIHSFLFVLQFFLNLGKLYLPKSSIKCNHHFEEIVNFRKENLNRKFSEYINTKLFWSNYCFSYCPFWMLFKKNKSNFHKFLTHLKVTFNGICPYGIYLLFKYLRFTVEKININNQLSNPKLLQKNNNTHYSLSGGDEKFNPYLYYLNKKFMKNSYQTRYYRFAYLKFLRLKKLNFNGHGIGEYNLFKILVNCKNKKHNNRAVLEKLKISNCDINLIRENIFNRFDKVNDLNQFSNLRILIINYNYIGILGFIKILNFFEGLDYFECKSCFLDYKIFNYDKKKGEELREKLPEVEPDRNLRVLIIDDNCIGFRFLIKILKACPELSRLSVGENYLNSAEIDNTIDISNNKIQRFRIGKNELFGFGGLMWVLKNFKALLELNFTNSCNIMRNFHVDREFREYSNYNYRWNFDDFKDFGDDEVDDFDDNEEEYFKKWKNIEKNLGEKKKEIFKREREIVMKSKLFNFKNNYNNNDVLINSKIFISKKEIVDKIDEKRMILEMLNDGSEEEETSLEELQEEEINQMKKKKVEIQQKHQEMIETNKDIKEIYETQEEDLERDKKELKFLKNYAKKYIKINQKRESLIKFIDEERMEVESYYSYRSGFRQHFPKTLVSLKIFLEVKSFFDYRYCYYFLKNLLTSVTSIRIFCCNIKRYKFIGKSYRNLKSYPNFGLLRSRIDSTYFKKLFRNEKIERRRGEKNLIRGIDRLRDQCRKRIRVFDVKFVKQ